MCAMLKERSSALVAMRCSSEVHTWLMRSATELSLSVKNNVSNETSGDKLLLFS